MCGDKVSLTLFVDDDDIIKDIKFSGEGCAISVASASLMTEKLKGKKLSYAENMFKDFTDLVKGSEDSLSTIDEDDSLYALKGYCRVLRVAKSLPRKFLRIKNTGNTLVLWLDEEQGA